MEDNYIGWIIEWGYHHRKRGMVLKEIDQGLLVVDEDENGENLCNVYLDSRVVKIKPMDISDIKLQRNIRKGLSKWKQDDPNIYITMMNVLSNIESKGISQVKSFHQISDTLDNVCDISTKRSQIKSRSLKKRSPSNSAFSSATTALDESMEDESVLGNYNDVSDDYEDDSESDDDENVYKKYSLPVGNIHEEVSDDTSEDEESDSDDYIDLKVCITLPPDQIDSTASPVEVRGFCVRRSKVVRRVTKALETDYGLRPRLYYRDSDGDDVLIRRQMDVLYALHVHNEQGRKLRLSAVFEEQRSRSSSLATRVNTPSLNPGHISPAVEQLNASDELNQASPMKVIGDNFIHGDGEFLWKKGELIGVGSFGQVFGGIHLDSGRRIAVKEVHLKPTNGHKEQAKAMLTEIHILSELEHPNIIKYLGAECTKDTLRIFLDIASEGSIKDLLNEFGGLAECILRRYTSDIITGLSFLHSKGYIHRDIKPSNLLIDKGIVKLADFGCTAAVKISSDGLKSEPQHNTVIGTTIYMSPEVMRGADKDDEGQIGYGRKADIWSLGITIVEMASGVLPFRNAAAAIYAVCVSKEIPTLPTEFSTDAHDFVARCLVEDSDDRADCHELTSHPFCRPLSTVNSRVLQHDSEISASKLHMNPDFDLVLSPSINSYGDHIFDFDECDLNDATEKR